MREGHTDQINDNGPGQWISIVLALTAIILVFLVHKFHHTRFRKEKSHAKKKFKREHKCPHRLRPVREIGVICTGVTPASCTMTCDGCYLYVPNNDEYNIPQGNAVSVLDLHNRILIHTIVHPSFVDPYRILMYGCKAFVANSGGFTVSVIDTRTRLVTRVIPGFDGPSGFVKLHTRPVAYVNNYGAGVASGTRRTIQRLDLCTETLIGDPIDVGLAPAAMAVSPDDRFVYIVNYVDGKVGTGIMSVLSVDTNTVIAEVPGLSGPFCVEVTPDGKRALVTNFGSNDFTPIGNTVSVICLTRYCITDTVLVGIQSAGLAIDHEGHFAYVTNYNVLYAGPGFTNLTPGQGTVNIIDLRDGKACLIGPTVAVGQGPNHLIIDWRRKRLYVANYVSNTVSVLALYCDHKD